MAHANLKAKLDAIFNAHMSAELTGDFDQTLATNPHLLKVPTMVGGQGAAGVQAFYSNRLVGQFSAGRKVLIRISHLRRGTAC
jgi:carboxymethylenebutenolidase